MAIPEGNRILLLGRHPLTQAGPCWGQFKVVTPSQSPHTRKCTSGCVYQEVSRKVVSCLPFCNCAKMLRQKQLRTEGFPLAQSSNASSQHRALDTTGHIASMANKQREMNTDTQLLFSHPQAHTADPKPGCGSTHSGQVLLPLLT